MKKIFGEKKYSLKKICQKKFCKNNSGQKKLNFVKKISWSKKIFREKKFGQTKFLVKKNSG